MTNQSNNQQPNSWQPTQPAQPTQPTQPQQQVHGVYSQGAANQPEYRKGSLLLLIVSIILGLWGVYSLITTIISYSQYPWGDMSTGDGVANLLVIIINVFLPLLATFVAAVLGLLYWKKPRKAIFNIVMGVVLLVLFGIGIPGVIYQLLQRGMAPFTWPLVIRNIVFLVLRLILAVLYLIGGLQNSRLNKRFY